MKTSKPGRRPVPTEPARGGRIRRARRRAGLSQAALARKVGVHSSAVNRWELGEGLTFDNIRAVARALDVRPGRLAFGER